MPIRSADDSELVLTETLLQKICRVGVIVNDEDAFFGRFRLGLRFNLLGGINFGVGGRRCFSSVLNRNAKCECGTFARQAVTRSSQISTEQAGEVAADSETETGATVFARGAGIGLLEFFKDA